MAEHYSLTDMIREEYDNAHYHDCLCPYCSVPKGFRRYSSKRANIKSYNAPQQPAVSSPIDLSKLGPDARLPATLAPVTVSDIKTNSITVHWQPPPAPSTGQVQNKQRIVAYELHMTIVDNNFLLKPDEYVLVYTGNKTEYTISCVQSGVQYRLRCRAMNAIGSSEHWSEPTTVKTLCDASSISSSDNTPIDHIPIVSNLQLREQARQAQQLSQSQRLAEQRDQARVVRDQQRAELRQKQIQAQQRMMRDAELRAQQQRQAEQQKVQQEAERERRYEQLKKQIAEDLAKQSQAEKNNDGKKSPELNLGQQSSTWQEVQSVSKQLSHPAGKQPVKQQQSNSKVAKQSHQQKAKTKQLNNKQQSKSGVTAKPNSNNSHQQRSVDTQSTDTTVTDSPALSTVSSTSVMSPASLTPVTTPLQQASQRQRLTTESLKPITTLKKFMYAAADEPIMNETLRVDALDIYNSRNKLAYMSFVLRSMGMPFEDGTGVSHDSVLSLPSGSDTGGDDQSNHKASAEHRNRQMSVNL